MSLLSFARYTCRVSVRFLKHSRYFSASPSFCADGKLKFSYYHEVGTFSFISSTFGDLVDEAAEDSPEEIAFSFPFQNANITFLQFKEETDQLAAGLMSLGLQLGDRVGILGPNSYQWLLSHYAAMKAGLVAVLINPASTESELAYVLDKVECRAVISAERFKKMDNYETLSALLPELHTSQSGEIKSERLKHLRRVIMMSQKTFPGTCRLQDVMQADDSAARRLFNDAKRKVQFDNPALIMFTSGTTGSPKAATATHFQVINQAKSAIERGDIDKENDVICVPVPLFHAFASIGGPPISLQVRVKCVFPAEKFDVPATVKAIQDEKCTMVYGVPTMFTEMLQHIRGKNYNLHWKKALIGASPVPPELMKCLRDEFGLNVVNGYGATETAAGACVQSISDSQRTFGTSGKPLEHVEIKIIDKDGTVVPVNTDGEVCCRSPFIFSGYWNQPDKTAEVLDSARWYHTGDIGRMDEEGNVCITGRIKDMVIRGGENIYPTEIENFILSHHAVVDVYVVGVPDEKYGEELCASIKLKEGCTLTEEEIKEFCKGKISNFKIPRYILFTEDFPKTESGKIKKHELREECIMRLKL